MVKTTAGFDRVMLLSRHCSEEELAPDVQQYLTQRYGKEWFKIPAKDGFRAKAAAAAGHDGCFKVILTGLFEDSFTDPSTGDTVLTINPSLMFEPCRPPAPKKEKSQKKKKELPSSLAEKVAEVDDEEEVGQPRLVQVGAQEVPIDLVEEDDDNDE